jgi:glycosyltransferase involved in cell wall biosynthesis
MSNRFVFIVPIFNASTTLARMLHSIVGQSYENWKIILIDDVSSEEEQAKCKKILYQFHELFQVTGHAQEKLDKVIWNSQSRGKQWEVSNDIICRIDGDDYLCELDALAMINSVYIEAKCDALWTKHRWGMSDKNISADMSQGADPFRHPWVSSHFKTFRKYLLNDVKDVNYRGEDGEYVRRAGDQAIYLPALYRSKKHVFFPRVLYHYNIKDVPATYQTDDAKFQRDEALFLRARGFVE